MKKQITLILIGLLPFLGYFQNFLMMSVPLFQQRISLLLISLVVLVFWFCICRFYRKFFNSKIEIIMLINAPAFIVLLLLLFQEFISGYWSNWAGILTQSFYLPILQLSFPLPGIVNRISFAYIMNFSCLLIASYLGCGVGEHSRKM